MDPVTLTRLLADGDRRRVVAALVLGAGSEADVRAATGLDVRRLSVALARLDAGGLVVRSPDGTVHLVDAAFAAAARATATAEGLAKDDDASEAGRVLRAFVRDGRLLSIPAQRSKRLVVLDLLAQQFEPGKRYPERTVNFELMKWHPDAAALRRYLVDEGFLDRESGEYWRSGGTVAP